MRMRPPPRLPRGGGRPPRRPPLHGSGWRLPARAGGRPSHTRVEAALVASCPRLPGVGGPSHRLARRFTEAAGSRPPGTQERGPQRQRWSHAAPTCPPASREEGVPKLLASGLRQQTAPRPRERGPYADASSTPPPERGGGRPPRRPPLHGSGWRLPARAGGRPPRTRVEAALVASCPRLPEGGGAFIPPCSPLHGSGRQQVPIPFPVCDVLFLSARCERACLSEACALCCALCAM